MLLSLVLGALVVLYPLAVWQLLERGRLDLAALVLVAAALTYVAAALVSVLQLLYYLSKTDRRGER